MVTLTDEVLMERIAFDFDSMKNKNYLTHNYHPYPAKFIPQIPRKLIETLSNPNDTVLDPFCGSGTTLVEAKLLGRNGIGVDLNPIATLISKAKTTILSEAQLKGAKKIVLDISGDIAGLYGAAGLLESTQRIPYKLPEFLNRDHWFEMVPLVELAIIRVHVATAGDDSVRDFLLTAFSSIIVTVSNQESDTRYARKDKGIEKGETYKIFAKKVDDMTVRMREFKKKATDAWTRIYRMDSRNLKPITDESVDLLVTSPPYLNAYDYYLYHRIRMHWLGSYEKEIQELEIGSRNKHSDEDAGIDEYFSNIEQCFIEARRVLKRNTYCCIVIGDAIKSGEYVHVDEKFNLMMERIGFLIQKQITYPLRKYTSSFTKGYKVGNKNAHVLIFKRI